MLTRASQYLQKTEHEGGREKHTVITVYDYSKTSHFYIFKGLVNPKMKTLTFSHPV